MVPGRAAPTNCKAALINVSERTATSFFSSGGRSPNRHQAGPRLSRIRRTWERLLPLHIRTPQAAELPREPCGSSGEPCGFRGAWNLTGTTQLCPILPNGPKLCPNFALRVCPPFLKRFPQAINRTLPYTRICICTAVYIYIIYF